MRVIAALCATGSLVGCGSSENGRTGATNEVSTTVLAAAPDPAAAEGERRIVALDGEAAEVVFALGAGDEVVAVDISTSYPPEAAALPKLGLGRALNAEPIIAFDPTIAIGTDAVGPETTLDSLRQVGIDVAIVDTELSPLGPAKKIRDVGAALGLEPQADELATAVQDAIDAAAVDPSTYSLPLKVLALYLRGDDVQYVLGQESGVSWLIDAAGASDVADELGVTEAAPISAEAILAAAPDVIIVPASGLESAGGMDALLAMPGIAETPAARNGAILVYDDQLMLGNGPRAGQLLATLVSDLTGVDARRTERS
jgi:iron complex transport system substrate-binding protein